VGQVLGWGGLPQPREFRLAEMSSDPQAATSTPTSVRVLKTGADTFSVSLDEGEAYTVTSSLSPGTNILCTFFPHTRLDTTLIRSPTSANPELTLFDRGTLYRLQLAAPNWAAKALGLKDVTNSVLAPMPCKILRVEVEAGQEVKKGQALVVIESMKMETVIRAPGDAKVKRVVHGKGEMCKAGTELVEFEDDAAEGQ